KQERCAAIVVPAREGGGVSSLACYDSPVHDDECGTLRRLVRRNGPSEEGQHMPPGIRTKHVAFGVLGLSAIACALAPGHCLGGQKPARSGGDLNAVAENKPAQPPAQWEYGQLYSYSSSQWDTADTTIKGEKWKDLAEKMKVPLTGKELAVGNYRMAVFNFL